MLPSLDDFTADPLGRPHHYALKSSLSTSVLEVFVTRPDQTLAEMLAEMEEEAAQAAAYATVAIAEATGLDPSAIDMAVGRADDRSSWRLTVQGASAEQQAKAAEALAAFSWFES